MTMHRTISKFGGSLGLIIPRDVAEVMDIAEGAPVRLALVGRQLVIEPEDDTVPADVFRRSYAAVLRRYGKAFEGPAGRCGARCYYE